MAKGVHGQRYIQTPMQQQQFTGCPAQHTRSKTTGMASVFAIIRACGCKTPQKRWLQRPNLLRLKRPRRMTTTTCIFAGRRRRWRLWITGSSRRCSTRSPKELGHIMQHQAITLFRCSLRHPRRSGVNIPEKSLPRVSRLCCPADEVTRAWISRKRTAFGAPDAASRGSPCGSRCFPVCVGQSAHGCWFRNCNFGGAGTGA